MSRRKLTKLLVVFGLIFTCNVGLFGQECPPAADFTYEFDVDNCKVTVTPSDAEVLFEYWIYDNTEIDFDNPEFSFDSEACFEVTGVMGSITHVVIVSDGGEGSELLECTKDFEFEGCEGEPCDSPFGVEVDGCTVTFTGNPNGIAHEWNFGDGNSGNGLTTEHRYLPDPNNPIFVVEYTVTMSNGEEVTCSLEVTPECVEACGTEVDVFVNKVFIGDVEQCGQYTIISDDLQELPCEDPEYFWDFGDGNFSTDPNPHPASNPRTYPNGGFVVTLYIKCTADDGEVTEYACSTPIGVTCHDNPCEGCDFFTMLKPRGNGSCSELGILAVPFCNPGDHTWTVESENQSDGYFEVFETIQDDPVLNICLGTINGYKDTELKVTHEVEGSNNGICEEIIPVPPGVFIGCQCNSVTHEDEPITISTLISEKILPDGISSFEDVFINGTLIIDQDYEFAGSNLNMGMGARIIVNDGIKLTLNDVTAMPEPGCDCMWQGIEVKGGVLEANNSTIMKAVYAIELKDGNGTIPLLLMRNNTLLANYIGILAENEEFFFGTFWGNSIIGGDLAFICDCFQGDIKEGIGPTSHEPDSNAPGGPDVITLSANYSYAGIFIDGSQGANLVIQNGLTRNTFSKLPIGINVNNANATIQNCYFEFISGYGFETTEIDFLDPDRANGDVAFGESINFIDVAGNHSLLQFGLNSETTFFDCVRGINVVAGGPNVSVEINNNIMDKMERGIDITSVTNGFNGMVGNVSNARIENNNITANKSFSFVTDPVDPVNNIQDANGVGIQVQDINDENSTYIIEGNQITIDTEDPSIIGDGNGIVVLGGQPIGLFEPPNGTGDPDPNSNLSENIFVRISDNVPVTINNGQSGIRVSFLERAIITSNEVIVNDINTNAFSGIQLEGGFNHNIQCNIVENINKSNVHSGILINAAQGSYAFNESFDFSEGMSFKNPCGTCDIRRNRFYGDMDRGLLYDLFAFTNTQVDKANIFALSSSDPFLEAEFMIDIGNGIDNSDMSRYIVFPSFSPSPFLPLTWFEQTGVALPYLDGCSSPPSGSATIPESGILNALDLLVANSGIENRFSEGNQYMLRKHLFEKLQHNPELFDEGSLYENFYLLHRDDFVGQLVNVQTQISQLFSLTDAQNEIYSNFTSNTKDNVMELKDLNYSTIEDLTTQLELISSNIKTNQRSFETMSEGIAQSRRNEATRILALNQQIQPEGIAALNEQYLNNLYLETIVLVNREINNEDKLQLRRIANQCYKDGGAAVFWARSWYGMVTGKLINYVDCSTDIDFSLKQENFPENDYNKLQVMPNPNSGSMEIRFELFKDSGHSLIISDLFGRKIKQVNLMKEQRSLKVELPNIPSGIYLIQLMNEDKLESVSKVIIE